MKELRDYQNKIVNDVLSSDRDIIVCLPTGSGKTVIASALIDMSPQKVLFVVPRLELIKQANKEFGNVDIIWSDKTNLEGRHCIIASKDSLRVQYSKLPEDIKEDIKHGIMIIDEAHVSIKQSHKLVNMINPGRVIGLTATPERMDGLALIKGSDAIHKYGIFDELLQDETVPSLQRKGYLSNLRYYARPIEGIADIKPENALAEELSDKQMMKIFNDNNIWGDLVRSYEEYGKGRPALGFTTTIAMGEKVVELFNSAGYDFRIIHGEMTIKERQELIHKLSVHEIDGLVNAALLTYGFDCPPVSYAFNCRHIKSRPLWFQIVGRILRPCEGKEDAIFIDHADSISEFSDPDCSLPILDETIVWRVNGESKEQRKARKQGMKKVQETMALIQELDPIPAKLVEITVENTWERLVRIIKKLRSENAILVSEKSELKDKLQDKQRKLEEQERTLQDKEVKSIKLKNLLEQEQQEKQKLIVENEKIKKEKAPAPKVIDQSKTFDYIRQHYIGYRLNIERMNPGIDRRTAHSLTKRKIMEDSNNLEFLFDRMQADKSFVYWFEHYEERIGR